MRTNKEHIERMKEIEKCTDIINCASPFLLISMDYEYMFSYIKELEEEIESLKLSLECAESYQLLNF